MDRTHFESLTWELSILCKSVHYPNLSGAAIHVGLSQPQLSRIITKLEKELDIVLLDRQVRRKSTWTPVAQLLAETYIKASDKLATDMQKVIRGHLPKEIQIGILEGLTPMGIELSKLCFSIPGIKRVELDVYDLNVLEEQFFNGSLDLILSSREPGRKKFQYALTLGYQHLETIQVKPQGGFNESMDVVSGFEYQRAAVKKPSTHRVFVSNSLAIRKLWLKRFGGKAKIPTSVKLAAQSETPVMLIGSEKLNPEFWKYIKSFKVSESQLASEVH